MASTTTITRNGTKTTIVRRSASEGGTYSYTTSKDSRLPTSIKGGSNSSSKRKATLEKAQQDTFDKLSNSQKAEEVQKIEEANIQAKEQEKEFMNNNSYGYTSTNGELIGYGNDPSNIRTRSKIEQVADNIRNERIEKGGNYQSKDGRVYNVQGSANPEVQQYQPPANYQSETGQVARVSYAPEKVSGRWGGSRIEEYNPPKKGFEGKVQDFLFKTQQVSRNPSYYETGRASVGFIASTGYYAGKTVLYEVPRAFLNPSQTIKGWYTLATSSEARTQLRQNIAFTVSTNPSKALGTAFGYVLTGKAIKGGTQVVQSANTLLKLRPTARAVTYTALGSSAVVYALSKPMDALLNTGRYGMAVFVGKIRKSPISKVQKSQMARGVVKNPKYSQQGNTFIKKTGRADKDRVSYSDNYNIKKDVRDLTVVKTQVRGRGSSRIKSTQTTIVQYKNSQITTANINKQLELGRGSSKTLGGKAYSRPPSQVSTGTRGTGDNALIVMQRQAQAVKNFRPQQAKPNLKQLPNKGQYYTGANQKAVLKEPKPVKLKYNSRTQSHSPVSKREARFQAFKEKLRIKGQRRQESKTSPQYGKFYELKNFFTSGKTTSRAIERVGSQRHIKRVGESSTSRALTTSEARTLAKQIKAVDKRPSDGVEVIYPNNAKAIRGESVVQEINLNSEVATASALVTLQPLAERQSQAFKPQNKARIEIINRGTQAQRIKPSQALILNRAQAQSQRQGLSLNQKSFSKSQSQNPPLIKPQQRQTERRVVTPPRPSRAVPRTPITNRFKQRKIYPPERIIPVTPLRPPRQTRRQEKGFNVLTRKGGVFIQATPLSLSKSEALNFGANLVKGTARASFKIVDSGSKAQGSYKTRGSLIGLVRQKTGIYVEPKKSRINTEGELSQITRKGQRARRTNKKGWLGL